MPGTPGRSGGDHCSIGGSDSFPRRGPPSKPAGLTREAQVVWDHLLEQLPEEVLHGVDCYQMEILCRCVVRARKLEKKAERNSSDLALWRAYLQTAQHITRLSAQFGLSPVDRKRISFEVQESDDVDEWMSEA